MNRNEDYSPATRALHVDRDFETGHGVAPAISQSVTYFADDAADFAHKAEEPLYDGFYARHGNATSSRIATSSPSSLPSITPPVSTMKKSCPAQSARAKLRSRVTPG